MAALLSQEKIPRNLIDTAIRMAESVADELTRGDDREVCKILYNLCFASFLWENYVQIYEIDILHLNWIIIAGLPRRIVRIATCSADSWRWVQFRCGSWHSSWFSRFFESIARCWHVSTSCSTNQHWFMDCLHASVQRNYLFRTLIVVINFQLESNNYLLISANKII